MRRLRPVRFVVAALLVAAAMRPAFAVPAAESRRVRVAVTPLAAAVEWKGDQPTGVMIDVWGELAGRLGVTTDYVREPTFPELMQCLPAGRADVALGPIAITEERERIVDLTHPIAHSGMRIAVRQRQNTGFLAALESLVSWRLLELLGLVVALGLLSGHLLWWVERRHNPRSFPPEYPRGVWEAVWWIVSTIVTGGCDDKHVDGVLGRGLALAWMIGGLVLIAAFTSVLTATMTAERVTGSIHGPRDLAGRTVGCQQAAVSVAAVRQRGGIVREFPILTDAFPLLEAGSIDAIVGENQQLMVLTAALGRPDIRLVGPIFESFDYGIAVAAGSGLREELNTAILRMREDGSLERITAKWLGRHD